MKQPREITFHHVGGSKHRHMLQAIDGVTRYALVWGASDRPYGKDLKFHTGPIETNADENGVTNEQLLAVVIDRLEHFQQGEFACDFNEAAIVHLYRALRTLKARTRERMERGVEGTHEP